MNSLNRWLQLATRHLSAESTSQVRREIREHYDSEREAAIGRGATIEEAEVAAVAALGGAKAANRQYRKVMLTSGEARLRRQSNAEARAICSRAWLKWTLIAAPLALLLAACALVLRGAGGYARDLLLIGLAMSVVFAAPFLPIYTPFRARVYRVVKWAALAIAVIAAFWPNTLAYFWLLASCMWIPVWSEWTRFSIRRKLPMNRWPRQLYL